MDNKHLKISINSITIGLSFLVLIGYLAWDKYSTQAFIQREAIIREAQRKQEAIARETQKKQEAIAYKKCISIASYNYNINWAAACKTHADSTADSASINLKACKKLSLDNAYFYASPSLSWEELQKRGDAICERRYKQWMSYNKPNCTLPTQTADYVNAAFKEEKDSCLISSKMEGRL